MDTRLLGDIAEAAILQSLTAAGMIVSVPFSRSGPYDLVAEPVADVFVRIQVKSGRLRKGCVEFNCCSTDHGKGTRSYADRADVFAVHVHATGEQFIVPVPVAAAGSKLSLRLVPAANNQTRRIRWAHDHRLAEWVARWERAPVSA